MGGDGRISHLARCTTAAAAEAESPPPAGRGRDRIHRDRQAGARASRRRDIGSARVPIPGTSWEARSEVTEAPRHRKGSEPAEAKRVLGRIASERRRDSGWLVGAAPARRPPWQAWRRAREMSAGTNTESFRRWSLLPPAPPCGEGRVRVTLMAGAPPGLPAHSSSTARPADRIVASRAGGQGVPGTSLHVRSPPVDTRSPPESPPRPVARNPGVAPPRCRS